MPLRLETSEFCKSKQNKKFSGTVSDGKFLIFDPVLFASPREKITRIDENYHQQLIITVELN